MIILAFFQLLILLFTTGHGNEKFSGRRCRHNVFLLVEPTILDQLVLYPAQEFLLGWWADHQKKGVAS